jgi:hypothetical protein
VVVTREHSCADCGVDTAAWESYMVRGAVWRDAGDVDGYLCIGCLELRLGRVLTPQDFPPLGANDDDPCDSVRLRTRKGSGRAVTALYGLAAGAVLELGLDPPHVAEVLGLSPDLLGVHVDGARFSRAAVAEDADDEAGALGAEPSGDEARAVVANPDPYAFVLPDHLTRAGC